MQQLLQAFQNRFAKKIAVCKLSSAEALISLKWFPLYVRRSGHHFEICRTLLIQIHHYNTRNDYLPRIPKPRIEWRRRITYYRAFNDWASLPQYT